MAKHQIIYTSCKRGIRGNIDGQQVWSEDANFDAVRSDEVSALHVYSLPETGRVMTEQLAAEMPPCFFYRKLGNGLCAVTLNTYLGRDYMGSSGRFGNTLSHSLICDAEDLTLYPAFLFGSTALRSKMEYEEVNSEERPNFLPVPELTVGSVVTTEKIMALLEEEENRDYFRRMLQAVLAFPETKKRVLICDTPENIMLWIGALQYALPLCLAKEVYFTSYAYAPDLADARICGVLSNGTVYEAENCMRSDYYAVFDFEKNLFSVTEEDSAAEAFLEFLETAFLFAPESMEGFKGFVTDRTSYRAADKDCYGAFDLYTLLGEGLEDMTIPRFRRALSFAFRFGDRRLPEEIASRILEDKENIVQMDREHAGEVLEALMGLMPAASEESRDRICGLITEGLIGALAEENTEEKEFGFFYERLKNMADRVGFSIPAQLMSEESRPYVLQAINEDPTPWKVAFVMRLLGEMVRDTEMDAENLRSENPLGKLYAGIFDALYKRNPEESFMLEKKMLKPFLELPYHFLEMTLLLLQCLEEMRASEEEKDRLFRLAAAGISGMTEEQRLDLFDVLVMGHRYSELYRLQRETILNTASLPKARAAFRLCWDNYVKNSVLYGEKYAVGLLEAYNSVFEIHKGNLTTEERTLLSEELLTLFMHYKAEGDCVTELMKTVTESLPLTRPTEENAKLLKQIAKYSLDVQHRKLSGKVPALIAGLRLDCVTARRDLRPYATALTDWCERGKVDFRTVPREEAAGYFTWVLHKILKLGMTAEDMEVLLTLYSFGNESVHGLMDALREGSFSACKDTVDYRPFAEYARFLTKYGDSSDLSDTGKFLSRMSTRKLEDLDADVYKLLMKDKEALKKWDVVEETARKTNPILSGLTDKLRSRRDKDRKEDGDRGFF